MIVTGLSEDRILEELVLDRKFVATEAKKKAKKATMLLLSKGQGGIDKDYYFNFNLSTHNNNNWYCVVIVNMKKMPIWHHFSVCKAESEHGTKDYYLVRGFSNDKPYFIKLSSHALKRFKERGVEKRLDVSVNYDGGYFAPLIFMKGETVTWMKIAHPDLLLTVLDLEENQMIANLFYTYLGCYLGYETEGGNFVFKTFLGGWNKLKKLEENMALDICRIPHILLNPSLYTKSVKDSAILKLKNDGFDDMTEIYKSDVFKFKLLP